MRNFVALLTLVAANAALAQHAGHSHQPQPSGYAGMQTREIKALSPEQVADLREGHGMGASLPAFRVPCMSWSSHNRSKSPRTSGRRWNALLLT